MNFTKKNLFWFIVLITLSGAFFFFDKKEEAAKQLKEEQLKLLPTAEKDISEFWINYIKESRQIKAVREKDEWDAGHIDGAVHIPRGVLEFKINEVVPDKNRLIIVQCKTFNYIIPQSCGCPNTKLCSLF